MRHRAANCGESFSLYVSTVVNAARNPGRRVRQSAPGRLQAKKFQGIMTVALSDTAEPTRRDFLYVATSTVGVVGACATLIPLITQMNPSADVLALASIEIDLTPIQAGQSVTFTWRSHPLFVRRRTPQEIAAARAVPVQDLIDPAARNDNLPNPDSAAATDDNRLTPHVPGATGATAPAGTAERPEWLVVVGVCTHLGCTPQASTALAPQGEFGGWLCHCHGSQYDVAGRVRVGPAPQNLRVPPYAFLSETRIKVG